MAQKKAPAKKATKKPAAKKKAPAKKTTKKAAPKVATYDELKAARDATDAADDRVADCVRALNRAKSIQGDFSVRDREVAEATAELQDAREAASEAQAHFEAIKRKAYLAR